MNSIKSILGMIATEAFEDNVNIDPPDDPPDVATCPRCGGDGKCGCCAGGCEYCGGTGQVERQED